jgi:hypothetical protein
MFTIFSCSRTREHNGCETIIIHIAVDALERAFNSFGIDEINKEKE